MFLKKTKITCSFWYNMLFYSVRFIIDEKTRSRTPLFLCRRTRTRRATKIW